MEKVSEHEGRVRGIHFDIGEKIHIRIGTVKWPWLLIDSVWNLKVRDFHRLLFHFSRCKIAYGYRVQIRVLLFMAAVLLGPKPQWMKKKETA